MRYKYRRSKLGRKWKVGKPKLWLNNIFKKFGHIRKRKIKGVK